MVYTLDKSGECITTTPENAEQIAMDLCERGHVVTTWADEGGSKFDLVWSYAPTRIGRSSMISEGPAVVWVGVVGKGCFGFGLAGAWLAPSYVGEKLKVSGVEELRRLAILIDGVRAQIRLAEGLAIARSTQPS